MARFRVYDVFTNSAFGGNQLAVVLDADGLPEDKLQKIAREFNFSETTFVYPPADTAKTAKVRIFTPTMEIPFAGHPTIGTAIALRDEGQAGNMVLELGVGPIPCRCEGELASFTTPVEIEEIAEPSLEIVAAAIGLSKEKISTFTHLPVQASLGLPFVVTELIDRQSLRDCQPNIEAFRTGAESYPAGLDFAQFVYVRNGSNIDARMFAPLDNIPEDPATGSACATLAALLRVKLGTDQTLFVRQGEDMGRISLIEAKADASGVTISGNAVKTMEGTLTV